VPEEETRLLADLTECHRLMMVASSALTHPVHSMVRGSDDHRKLVEADRAARTQHKAALLALRVYRAAQHTRVSGAGG
jgi:hypothetical protein